MITLIGFGVNDGDISLNAYRKLKECERIFVRSSESESCKFLIKEGLPFTTFDNFYSSSRSFDTLNKKIVKEILKNKDSCFLVDGAVCEDECCRIVLSKTKNVKVFNGVSKTESALAKNALGINYTAVSAFDVNLLKSGATLPLAVYDIGDFYTACQVKEKLSDLFGEERVGFLVSGEKIVKIKVYELDREENFDLNPVFILPDKKLQEKQRFCYDDIISIINILRSPNGCPWDKVQTADSILKNLIEECYELVDAIKLDDDDKIEEEIGDVLLQCAFHTVFGQERGAFTNSDVISRVCSKLITRHTHVFGQDNAQDASRALEVWEKNKHIEKNLTTVTDDVKAVPKIYPALIRAQKTFKRAVKGFNDTVQEQSVIDEIKNFASVGELLFSACKLAYVKGVDAEEELTKVIEDYILKVQERENLNK